LLIASLKVSLLGDVGFTVVGCFYQEIVARWGVAAESHILPSQGIAKED